MAPTGVARTMTIGAAQRRRRPRPRRGRRCRAPWRPRPRRIAVVAGHVGDPAGAAPGRGHRAAQQPATEQREFIAVRHAPPARASRTLCHRLRQRRRQRREEARVLGRQADGHAQPFGQPVAGHRAHDHAARQQLLVDTLLRRADAHQHEVGVARDDLQAQAGQRRAQVCRPVRLARVALLARMSVSCSAAPAAACATEVTLNGRRTRLSRPLSSGWATP